MGKALSTFQEKVKWMMAHEDLWRGWPSCRLTDDQLIKRMKDDGLISKGAHNYDVMDFGKLVAAARSQLKHARVGDFL